MNELVFVDANVFVYARDPRDPQKQGLAASWIKMVWDSEMGCTSVQVLNECYTTLTQKIRPALRRDVAWDYVTELLRWAPRQLDTEVIVRARDIQLRYGLNWWDCLIVASAQIQNCALLLTEDMQDRATYGTVKIWNPFSMALSDSQPSTTYGTSRTNRPTRYGY